jgi:N-ethylmaleimide reductase
MSKLFSPIRIGAINLSHRLVLAPLTRMRADLPGNVPNDLMTKYYEQRASQGGLMITEASFISPTGHGAYASPGIFSDAQVAGWRKVVEAVHAKGAKILLQLWHVGRQSHVDLQPNGQAPIAPSAIQAEVRALRIERTRSTPSGVPLRPLLKIHHGIQCEYWNRVMVVVATIDIGVGDCH